MTTPAKISPRIGGWPIRRQISSPTFAARSTTNSATNACWTASAAANGSIVGILSIVRARWGAASGHRRTYRHVSEECEWSFAATLLRLVPSPVSPTQPLQIGEIAERAGLSLRTVPIKPRDPGDDAARAQLARFAKETSERCEALLQKLERGEKLAAELRRASRGPRASAGEH